MKNVTIFSLNIFLFLNFQIIQLSHVDKDNNLSNRLNVKLTISHNGHTDRQTELRKCTVVYVNKNCTDFIKRLHSQYIFFTIFFIAFTYLHDKKIVHDESRHRSIAFRTESDFIHVLCSKYISTIVLNTGCTFEKKLVLPFLIVLGQF